LWDCHPELVEGARRGQPIRYREISGAYLVVGTVKAFGLCIQLKAETMLPTS